MVFIYSMLIGGAICAVTQILSEIKIPFPVVAVIMVALGGVLTPVGLLDILNGLGLGGVSVTAVGCGNAAYSAGAAIASGNGMPLVIVTLLLVVIVALGAASGGALRRKDSE